MLKLDLNNLYNISNTSQADSLSLMDLKSSRAKLTHYQDLVYSRKQGFMEIVEDTEVVNKLKVFAQSIQGKYDSIVILGIGGSMLGPKCILDAFYVDSHFRTKVYCLDNIDPYKIAELESQIKLNKTLFLVQTKSGQTPETVAQYLYFRNKTDKQNLQAQEHFVFVTDPEKGYLRKIANTENIPSFEIPENVGGRFSVLTPIGLLISAILGINIEKILVGAQSILDNNLQDVYSMAVVQYGLLKKGKNINIIMPYSSRLKTFSEWCVQLLSESLGKEFNLSGELVNTGLTPVPAVGATDQHSQLQLFAEGPNDKLVIFIKPQDYEVKLAIPNTDEQSLAYLNGHSFNDLLDAEFEGVRQALTERNRPNITLEIQKVDEQSLGALFMFFELATAFAGEMMKINTFDQPGVERSKVLSKENLAGK